MQSTMDYFVAFQQNQDDDAASRHSSSSSDRSHQSVTPQRRAEDAAVSLVCSSRRRRYVHNPYSATNPDGRSKQHASDIAVAAASAVTAIQQQQLNHSAATSGASSNNNSFAAPSAQSVPTLSGGFDYDNEIVASAVSNNTLPAAAAAATLHVELVGRVTFVPYPLDSSFMESVDHAQIDSDFAAHGAARLFVGQLPHKVTQCQLDWLFACFAGVTLRDCERITKKNTLVPNGPRLPTGCIHANLPANRIAAVCALLHKKILIDDSGVWYAATPAEEEQLAYYVQLLKADPRRRFPGRPAESLVVQQAESRFFPSQPRWVSNAPEAEAFLTYSRGFYSNENKQSANERTAHAARLNSSCNYTF